MAGHDVREADLGTMSEGGSLVAVRTARRPEVVVRDPSSGEVPGETFPNSDGTWRLHVCDGRVRLIDTAPGVEVPVTLCADYIFRRRGAVSWCRVATRRASVTATAGATGCPKARVQIRGFGPTGTVSL